MTKIDIGEYKHLLGKMKELKLTLGLSFNGTKGTINEFSDDTKLNGVAWSSTKSYFSTGYTPMLDGLSDLFYTTITTLQNFIRAFESEVTDSGVRLDLDHLQDLQRRRDELQREKNELLPQILEQASKIPGLGHLFDDYSLLQAEKKVQLMEDFQDFIYRHDSDFSELNGMIEQLLLGLDELGKQRSFNGATQGYSPINFMNLAWSKSLDQYHKKNGEEVKKVQKKDIENFKNMAEVAGGAAAMESFGANTELANIGSSMYSTSKDYFSKTELPSGNSAKVKDIKLKSTQIIEEINNPVLSSPRTGSGLKTDEVKPIKGKGSLYAIDPLTGAIPGKQTQTIIDEFPTVPKAHGFSDIVDNYAGFAQITDLGNAKLYQIQGSQNGVPGRFEWIIQDGQVTHRMFIRNPELNGVPIK